jgi:hypothetical protein
MESFPPVSPASIQGGGKRRFGPGDGLIGIPGIARLGGALQIALAGEGEVTHANFVYEGEGAQ